MNEVRNLEPLYRGFDAPAFGANMGKDKELIAQHTAFGDLFCELVEE